MDHRSDSLRARLAPSSDRTTTGVPRRLGPWLLEHVIGTGAMAVVYRARSADTPDTPARYAIKILAAERQSDALAIAFFRREAAIGRRLSHPHLVSVLSAHTGQPPLYLAMPYLAGRTVEERLASGELFPLPHALWIARQVAEALNAVHDAGCLHGDVKPGNVMVAADGHTTLLDLGFARELAETGSALDRPLAGTVSYLAPELLTSIAADERSDLYSLGATLFEMLTGRPPYQAASFEELAERQRQGDAPDVRSLAPQVPMGAATLIRSLLARDPSRRPRRAAEVVARLVALEVSTLSERIPA